MAREKETREAGFPWLPCNRGGRKGKDAVEERLQTTHNIMPLIYNVYMNIVMIDLLLHDVKGTIRL